MSMRKKELAAGNPPKKGGYRPKSMGGYDGSTSHGRGEER
jgi:hypothetical protein